MIHAARLAPLALAVLSPVTAGAQDIVSDADSIGVAPPVVRTQEPRAFSWLEFSAGFLASVAAHELGHLGASLVMGGRPSIGFNKGRPVIYSGIDPALNPHRQFAFSASGMAVQLLINEVILDWPHGAGFAREFTRGVLAGGVGTVLFYFTVGRTSAVGDVRQMADNSGLSTWALTAIYGGVAATDVLRIALDRRYAHFFAFPGPQGLLVGLTVTY